MSVIQEAKHTATAVKDDNFSYILFGDTWIMRSIIYQGRNFEDATKILQYIHNYKEVRDIISAMIENGINFKLDLSNNVNWLMIGISNGHNTWHWFEMIEFSHRITFCFTQSYNSGSGRKKTSRAFTHRYKITRTLINRLKYTEEQAKLFS